MFCVICRNSSALEAGVLVHWNSADVVGRLQCLHVGGQGMGTSKGTSTSYFSLSTSTHIQQSTLFCFVHSLTLVLEIPLGRWNQNLVSSRQQRIA